MIDIKEVLRPENFDLVLVNIFLTQSDISSTQYKEWNTVMFLDDTIKPKQHRSLFVQWKYIHDYAFMTMTQHSAKWN